MRKTYVINILAALLVIQCLLRPTYSEEIWYVYHDLADKGKKYQKHGEWTNYMPSECGNKEAIDPLFGVEKNVNDPIPPAGGDDFIKIHFNIPADSVWCGIAVASTPNYVGERQSNRAFSLSEYTTLRYLARGKKGGEIIQIRAAIYGDKPYGDSAKDGFYCPEETIPGDYWKSYCCNLSDPNVGSYLEGLQQALSRVISPFAVYYNSNNNNKIRNATFYLDEIRFSNISCPETR